MSDPCGRTFDEALLSGYVDRVLTQGDRQRVDVHLGRCPSCRELVAELQTLRAATLSTAFAVPDDRQWDERPRSGGSRATRGVGWVILALWALSVAAYGLWMVAQGGSWEEQVLVFGGVGGIAALFVSVLLDRLRDLPHDRYRGVMR